MGAYSPSQGLVGEVDRPDRLVLGNPKTRAFAELLIDCEEDRTFPAVLVGMLREDVRQRSSSSALLSVDRN